MQQKPGKKGKKKEKLRPLPDQTLKLMKDSEKLLKKLDKVFPREKYLQPKDPIFRGLGSEPNQNPFVFLDSLYYMGLPKPEAYRKKAKLAAATAGGLNLEGLTSAASSPVPHQADTPFKD